MDTKLFKIGKEILLLFLIIYMGSLISWVFRPLIVIFETLFIPIILSGFLFYLLRPLVKLINKKLSKGVAILIVYLGLGCILAGLIMIIIPMLQKQLYSLTNNMPLIILEFQQGLRNIAQNDMFQQYELNSVLNIESLLVQLTTIMNEWGKNIALNMGNFIGTLASSVLVLVIVPFILFYMLKDGEKFERYILGLVSEKHQDDVERIFKDIDRTLGAYIQGQGIVCLCVGVLCYIVFLMIGLDYALLLAVAAGVTNIIPYIGPWIGTVPAVIVGLFQSPITALLVIICVVVIQQIESSFISPQVIGKKMQIHPITVMFLILIAGRLIGLIGMILAVPAYAIGKVIVVHGLKIWRLRIKKQQK